MFGGTLLNKNTVLTASHCFGFAGQPTHVRVGDTDISSTKGICSLIFHLGSHIFHLGSHIFHLGSHIFHLQVGPHIFHLGYHILLHLGYHILLHLGSHIFHSSSHILH